MSKSMSIGKTIKKLRRERDITQEQLAAYLGITSRAVSQWECDRTAPDITQLPLLSAIFDTTTDAILGVDLQRNEERIERLVEEAAAFSRSGDFAAETRLLEDGLKQYPRSYRIMAELAEALSCSDLDEYAHTVGAAADVDAVSHRVRALCDTVIDECTEETVRDRAFQTIIYRCKNSGQSELAAAYANRLPHMWASREDMLVGIYEQQADPALLHRYAAFCTDRLAKCLALLAATDRFGKDEKNRLLHQIADIVNTVYCEQDSNYYAHHLVSAYQTLAENYALARDKENTLLCLEKMCEAGILFDTYPEEAAATSPAVRGERRGRPVPREKNACARLLECLSGEPWYDFLRAEQSFAGILRRLEAHSNA